MIRRRTWHLLLGLLILTAALLAVRSRMLQHTRENMLGPSAEDKINSPYPAPDLTPEDVIKIQVDALRHNDELQNDQGIAIVYRFASPENQRHTGPLERFTQMVKTPLYEPMFHFTSARFGPPRIKPDHAQQAVVLTTANGPAIYLFTLSLQPGGPLKGCWLTDGVMRIPTQSAPPPHDLPASSEQI